MASGTRDSSAVCFTRKADFDELLAGSTKRATFTVHNIGSPRTFRIVVTDARQLVRKVEPRELSLGMDESGIVQVNLTVPAETAPGVEDDVVVRRYQHCRARHVKL